MAFVTIYLFITGLCLGSFVNALCWRIRQQELIANGQKLKAKKTRSKKLSAISYQPSARALSIMKGRSMCPNCKHQLETKDLLPVVSWLFLRGKCRYCKKPISWQYPVVELSLAIVFAVSYIFWPIGLDSGGQKLLLGIWLVASVGLMALLVYDHKWMLLPNRILYPTFFIALAGRLGYIVFFASDKAHSFWLLALSLLVASGIFFGIFVISSGRWIGYGDVRLGLITGVLLADPLKALLMIFIASILGTIFVLPDLLKGRQKMTGKLPFGPFLIVATLITILAGNSIIGWYKNLLF